MSNPIPDGGCAFPHTELTQEIENGCRTWDGQPGMYLRDYFAAKAMQSLIAMRESFKVAIEADKSCDVFIAESAYGFADAMLKQREAK